MLTGPLCTEDVGQQGWSWVSIIITQEQWGGSWK